MDKFADSLDAVNRAVGLTVRWAALAMVLLQFGVVLLRYVFGISDVALNESVLYLHAALFMLAAGYTLLVDEHVRVDILSMAPTNSAIWAPEKPATRATSEMAPGMPGAISLSAIRR